MQEKNQKNIHNKSEHTFASFCTQMYSLQITKIIRSIGYKS